MCDLPWLYLVLIDFWWNACVAALPSHCQAQASVFIDWWMVVQRQLYWFFCMQSAGDQPATSLLPTGYDPPPPTAALCWLRLLPWWIKTWAENRQKTNKQKSAAQLKFWVKKISFFFIICRLLCLFGLDFGLDPRGWCKAPRLHKILLKFFIPSNFVDFLE